MVVQVRKGYASYVNLVVKRFLQVSFILMMVKGGGSCQKGFHNIDDTLLFTFRCEQ